MLRSSGFKGPINSYTKVRRVVADRSDTHHRLVAPVKVRKCMAIDGRLDVLEPIQEIVVGPVVGTRLFPCSDPPLDLTQVLEIGVCAVVNAILPHFEQSVK